MSIPRRVKIVEVGPRDGLQNENAKLDVETRVALIGRLRDCGLKTIEAGSFVNPAWVPQMANSGDVVKQLVTDKTATYPVLVPNLRGLDDAIASGAREIAVFAAASETFSQKNINCSVRQSIERFSEVIEKALAVDIKIRGYISCVMGCPYEGDIDPVAVADLARQLKDLGCYEISLGDTIGTGTPRQTRSLVEQVSADVAIDSLAVHFHDTYGQALANIYCALESGISVVDSSVAGLGGCPYAKGASGNVATEDVVYMLNGLGIDHGVDLDKLVETGRFICKLLQRPVMSKVNLAWA
jgi:isopropylmalate/homocitrate/citramalate synthase